MTTTIQTLGIVGAGAMGRGITQIAAQAGVTVRLYDTQPAAVQAALDTLTSTWAKLVEKDKMTEAQCLAAMQNVQPCAELDELADCDAVIEAIVEKIEVKRELFAALEKVVRPDAILASNTSSLSITGIAVACQHPERVAGYHFFNPVPLMKVVEVIDGLRTAPAVGDSLMALSTRMGHTAVRCKDMPGFIVNHAGRGMNTEGLKIAQENIAPFAEIDAIMREQAGFRMGPFELLDLTALDVSHPVMESLYNQFYQEPRFRPSPITAVRYAGGLLGRKTSQGFYRYVEGKKIDGEPQQQAGQNATANTSAQAYPIWLSSDHAIGYARAAALLLQLGVTMEQSAQPSSEALVLLTPFGEDTTSCALRQGLDPSRSVAIDCLFDFASTKRRVLMSTPITQDSYREAALHNLGLDGVPVTLVQDSYGFVAQRIVACIVNIACDIAQQNIATPSDIDRAVKLGLGYPQGPLSMGDSIGADLLAEVLRNLLNLSGDPRYRASPWLQRRAKLGVSLLQEQ